MDTTKTQAVHPLRTVTLTDKEWGALNNIVGNGWGDGDYEGYGDESPATQKRAMKKLREAKAAPTLVSENQKMRAALERIAQFDAYEPAGPAALDAREVLASLTT